MRYLGQGHDIRPKPFTLTGHREIDVDAPSSRSGDPAHQEDESLMPCGTRLPSETALVFCEKPYPSCLYPAPQRCLSCIPLQWYAFSQPGELLVVPTHFLMGPVVMRH